jgi:hypothetical protein
MNSKPAKRLAAALVAKNAAGKALLLAEAAAKRAHTAKLDFKLAKKTWKLARKAAKRTAKEARLAQKKLAKFSALLKKAKQPSVAKTAGSKARRATRPAERRPTARSPMPIVSASPIPSAEPSNIAAA